MEGRYGRDELGNFILGVCIALVLINLFVEVLVISIIESALLIYLIFRFMSRNIYKRQAENQKFLKIKDKIKSPFVMAKNKWRDRKTHVYKKCPNCKSTLRLPKTKGEHTVRCVRCGHRFGIRIR
jgi:DNA-directed RNA polymerase subunit RPC12/RpoP